MLTFIPTLPLTCLRLHLSSFSLVGTPLRYDTELLPLSEAGSGAVTVYVRSPVSPSIVGIVSSQGFIQASNSRGEISASVSPAATMSSTVELRMQVEHFSLLSEV